MSRYLFDIRPRWAHETAETLFVTVDGAPFSSSRLTAMVGRYIEAAGIEKPGSCHLFRHTMATLILEGGADIRFIQQMLGHARLNSTEIYTRVAIAQLAAIHTATHPAATNSPHRDPDLEDLLGDERDVRKAAANPSFLVLKNRPHTGSGAPPMTASQSGSTLGAMTTVELPDDVAAALAAAAAERGMTVDELAAETISARFGPKRRTLSFVAAGHSRSGRGGAEAEELLEEGGFGIDSADR